MPLSTALRTRFRHTQPEWSTLCVAAMVLMACGSPGADVGPAVSASETQLIWPNVGVMLPAGHRTAVAADGSGWVLTQPFVDDTLVLAKLSLSNGSLVTSTVIDATVHGYAGAGLSADGSGHLWITYGERLVRFDESTASVTSWSLPAMSPRLATDNPLAGSALTNAWNSSNKVLLFVRNDDQRLYGFDPSTSAFTVASELQITTSSISRIAIGAGDEVAVTGSVAGAVSFSPAAVRLASLNAQPVVLAGVTAVCIRPAGIAFLRSNGAVGLDDNSVLATIPAPLSTQEPFACDAANNVFEAAVGGGEVLVVRASPTGALASVTDALIPVVAHGVAGPINTYANPHVAALMPDLQGGVWLVSEAGTNRSTNLGSAYPTLAHVTF